MSSHGSPYRQRGAATLFGLVITLSVMGVILFKVVVPLVQEYNLQTEARRTGNFLAQYHTAVRHFYAYHGVTSVPTGVRTGTDWLKDLNACFGGTYTGSHSPPEPTNPPQGFLPCSFPSSLGFGLVPGTTLSVAGNSFTATTRLGPFVGEQNNQPEPRVAALVLRAAEAQSWDEGTRASGVFFGYSTSLNPVDPDFAFVVGTATNNFAVSEIYLPRDGSLPMQGELDMGTNDIGNIGDIAGSGSLAMSQDVIAGNNVLAGGRLMSNQDMVSLRGDVIASQGNVIVNTGDVIATSGNIIANRDLVAATGNMVAGDGFIRNVQIDGRPARLSQALFDKRVVPSTSVVTAPLCPGGSRALIFAVPEAFVSGNPAYPIYGVNRLVQDLGAGQYRINVLILINDAGIPRWVTLPPQYGLANISMKCP